MELPKVDRAEITYLILQYLSSSNCTGTAELLLEEARQQHLLPTRTDIFGREHAMSYGEMKAHYRHVAPNYLYTILQQHLQYLQTSSDLLRGLGTILGAGCQKPGGLAKDNALAAPSSLPDKLMASRLHAEHGLARGLPREDSVRVHVDNLKHLKTIRGHRVPVYCLAFDRTGKWLITGSDDRIVKIWSMQTGLLQMACRGHSGEITDLAVSCDNTMVASSSNDRTARVWDLEDSGLGSPVSALLGHSHVISFIDFHPIVPAVLVSSSLDGTCRIWDARLGGKAVHVLSVGPQFGPTRQLPRNGQNFPRPVEGAQADEAVVADQPAGNEDSTETTSLLVCSFSPDGTYLVAGAVDCTSYAWSWEDFSDRPRAAVDPWSPGLHWTAPVSKKEQWAAAPKPVDLGRLLGHSHDVLLLQFSYDGSAFATGSRDGTLRVWRRPRRRGQPIRGVWQTVLVLSLPIDEAEAAQARRRRRSLPAQSITQLTWTKNDRYILGAVSTAQIAVWDAHTGVEKQRLTGHLKSVHILQGHPTLYNIAMSASYDGQTFIWDITTGTKLKKFSSTTTRPGGGCWVDPLHLMDGQWTVDGIGIVVSDSAGQVHIYGVGSEDRYARARYDQFVEGENRPLQQDANGVVIDAVKQLPPNATFTTDQLCDITMAPYPQDYQEAWRSGSLWRLSPRNAQLNLNGTDSVPPAIISTPPFVTSAIWAAQENDLDEFGQQVEVDRAVRRQYLADDAAAAATEAQLQQQPAPAEPVVDVTTEAEASQPEAAAPAPGVLTRRRERQSAVAQQGGEAATGNADFFDDGFDEVVGTENMTRAERLALRNQRRDEQEEMLQRQRRGRLRRRDSERESERSEGRRRKRSRRLAEGTEDEGSETDEDDLFEPDEEEHPRRSRSGRASNREATEAELAAQAPRRGRPAKAYAWLQASKHRPGVYVPQLGDAVVYISQGHKQYLDITNDKTPGPWTTLQDAEGSNVVLRAAEPCTVVALSYRVAEDRTANTYAVVRLQFTEEALAGLPGREFDVDIPPSHLGQAEFVVLRRRFDTALRHDYEIGHRCKIYYPDEDSGGRWYYGWAVNDKLPMRPLSNQMPFDTAMWERFEIVWDEGDPALPSATAPDRSLNLQQAGSQTHIITSHAAWEIFDPVQSHFAALVESGPHDEALSEDLHVAVLSCMEKLRFQPFVKEPQPDDCFYVSRQRGVTYYNRVVELPMSLCIISQRLGDRYYRQAAAARHDLSLLISNAVAFNGEDSDIAQAATRLVSILFAVLDGEKDYSNMFSPEDEVAENDEAAAGPALAVRRPSRRRRVVFEDDDISSEEEEEEEEEVDAEEHRALTRQRRSSRLQDGSTDPTDRTEGEARPRRERHQVRRYSPEADSEPPPQRPTIGMSLRSRHDEAEPAAVLLAEPNQQPRRSDSQVEGRIRVRVRPAQPVQATPEPAEAAGSRRSGLRSHKLENSRSSERGRESEESEDTSAHEPSSDDEPRSSRRSTRKQHKNSRRSTRADADERPAETPVYQRIMARLRARRASSHSTNPQEEQVHVEGTAEAPALAVIPEEADGPATGVDHGRRSRRLVAARSEQERPVADDAEESRASRCSRRKRPDSSRPGLRNRQRPSYREVDESDED